MAVAVADAVAVVLVVVELAVAVAVAVVGCRGPEHVFMLACRRGAGSGCSSSSSGCRGPEHVLMLVLGAYGPMTHHPWGYDSSTMGL